MTPEDIHIALLRLLDICKLEPPEPMRRQIEDFLRDFHADAYDDGFDDCAREEGI
jgi:hypothetical protein